MKPIREGQRGPAVEDVQRRLLLLGYDLGPTGIDGVFLNHTLAAVRDFRNQQGLGPEGIVDDQTWKLLVDATFTMGDRNLYLKHPFFHGRDVLQIQESLTTLGFACGKCDGIFGTYTENAVKEFQLNMGLGADGIAGDETFASIERLRHVWEGKNPVAHSGAQGMFVRAEQTLEDLKLALYAESGFCEEVARRTVNLAKATIESASIHFCEKGDPPPKSTNTIVHIVSTKTPKAMALVSFGDYDTLANRIKIAANQQVKPAELAIVLEGDLDTSERGEQSIAVRLLDAFCASCTSK